MPFQFIDKAIGAWLRDVRRLRNALSARPSGSESPPNNANPPSIDQPDTGSPEKPRKIRPFVLLDRFGLVRNTEPDVVLEREMEIMRKWWPNEEVTYSVRRFSDPFEAINHLRPFVSSYPLKYLFLKGRNGVYCILTNGYRGSAPGFSTAAKLGGFDALDVGYRANPWDYYIELYTNDGPKRRVWSRLEAGGVNAWSWQPLLDFEDPDAIKRLMKGKPIGRGEIAKFCGLFGWPLPASREGLDFITECAVYEITPNSGTQYVSPEEEASITLIPPAWLGEEADLFAAPPEDPIIAKREAARRKWTKFRRAFQGDLKERFVTVRHILVLPRDGIERQDEWIDLIAPDDGVLLKDFEERAIADPRIEGGFYVEALVLGIDENHDVYAVLEIKCKPVAVKEHWQIVYADNADVPVPVYIGDPEEGVERTLFDLKRDFLD